MFRLRVPASFQRLALVGFVVLTLAPGCSDPGVSPGPQPEVELWRVPEGGIQPRAVVDDEGIVHLIYVDGGTSRVLYTRRSAAEMSWSPSIVVSEELPISNFGAISAPGLALGVGDRPHVVWYDAESRTHYHARLSDEGTRFEDPVSVAAEVEEEVGPAVAADSSGRVVVAWHAGSPLFESRRTVWVAVSTDGGVTFGERVRAVEEELGACGCCSLDALGTDDRIYIVYRAAGENIDRDMTLLTSTDGGSTFESASIHPWRINACPVATTSLQRNEAGDVAVAWETEGRVYFAQVADLERPIEAGADAGSKTRTSAPVDRRKNPAVAVAPSGTTLVAWGSGRSWQKGGKLGWQLFDPEGKPIGTGTEIDSIPDKSLPTAVALGNDRFVVVY